MNRMISIIDTKAGNLFSLSACLERIGFNVTIARTPQDVVGEALVIPGQGHFGTVMKNLVLNGWVNFLNQWRNEGNCIVGICVGMQIMFESSEESSTIPGLGWISGRAEKLNFPKQPMVGWAATNFIKETNEQLNLPSGVPYFVNSYAVRESEQCIASTQYGETFCAAVRLNNVVGFQFHPEKSSAYGQELLRMTLMHYLKNSTKNQTTSAL
ncbi:MAG: imidazole glycerol phosphate synthase subunit HisH [Gammaproteobacteria bacterium]|nr:imidazole glycerol phosphate synthase subunit HisH [Gammaproteobacteria bacterium]